MSSTELGTPHRLRTKMVVMLADLVYRIPYIASSVSSYLDISSYQLIDGQKRIKQYLYPDYYYNHEEQDWHELESHAGMHPNTTIPCILLTCLSRPLLGKLEANAHVSTRCLRLHSRMDTS
jgi:hypothetical protein